MTIRPIRAYAVVNKKKPKLDVLDVFAHKDIVMTKEERLIRVIISVEK